MMFSKLVLVSLLSCMSVSWVSIGSARNPTEMLYASIAVNAPKNSKFVGYDFRFQKVRSMNPIAPNSEIHIIHALV